MSGKRRGRARGATGPAQNMTRERRQSHYSTVDPFAGSTPIFVGARAVGHVAGDTFYKRVRGSAHFLRTPRAIAFDESTLRDAERAGARYVEVTDAETGRVYRAPFSLIWAKGFTVNRGHGEQRALVLAEFNRPAETPAQLPLFAF